MDGITQIKKLSLWIFIIPLVSINLCLYISINYSLFENTYFSVDQIGRSNFSIPYFDGSLSISRASRTFPQFLIFKPAMILTGIFLILYWKNTNIIINNFKNTNNNYSFKYFGIASAFFLMVHSIFLGIEYEEKIIKLLRRVILLGFILAEIVAQASLVYQFYKIKKNIRDYFDNKVLILKTILVSILVLVALLSLPILGKEDNVHFKHALEWNYFIGIIIFYLLTYFFWKRSE